MCGRHTVPDWCCKTCCYWRHIQEDGGPVQPGICEVVRDRPFWLHRPAPQTFASEGTHCEEWAFITGWDIANRKREERQSCVKQSSSS